DGIRDFHVTGVQTWLFRSQGYHGVNAAGKYPVKGILKFGSPELNKQMIYLPLKTAQQFYGAPGLLTSVAVAVTDKNEVKQVLSRSEDGRVGKHRRSRCDAD